MGEKLQIIKKQASGNSKFKLKEEFMLVVKLSL